MSAEPFVKAEIDRLTGLLLEASRAYYNSGETLLADEQYDLLLHQLNELEAAHPPLKWPDSPTEKVGSEPKGDFPKQAHPTPMLSLENISEAAELELWGKRMVKELDGEAPEYCCEAKLDGLSMSVLYRSGALVRAVTRGNGEVGDEVTESVKTIRTLPHQLKEPLDLELRGEVMMDKAAFFRLNQELTQGGSSPLKNPRNAAAGSLRLKDPKEVARRGLSIYFYDWVSTTTGQLHHQNLEQLQAWGLPTSPLRLVTQDLAEVLAFCQKMEADRGGLDFEIDGVVIKINDLSNRARLGRTAKFPVWARAWKFRPDRALTQLVEVENSIGRTGVLTPVAVVNPVDLGGTTVRRASLHNYVQVNQVLGLCEKDWVYLEKGGDVIPKVVAVELGRRTEQTPIAAPQTCPFCDQPLRLTQKTQTKKAQDSPVQWGVELYCENPVCPAVSQAKIEHFVSKKALDVHQLGPRMIKNLMQASLVATVADLFALKDKTEALLALEGLAEVSVQKMLVSIEAAKTRPLNQFIFGLGIPQVGEKAAKLIAMEVKTLVGFKELTEAQLADLAEIGPVLKASLLRWLAEPGNQKLLARLQQLRVNPAVLKRPEHQPFSGKTLCITGTLSKKRSEWKYQLEQVGFKVTSAVSTKTHYLLKGEEGGAKVTQAENLGVKVLDERQMELMLESKE